MRTLLAAVLSLWPLAASAQFSTPFNNEIGVSFGSGGGNGSGPSGGDQFIGNGTTADGSGRDMTREPQVRSSQETTAREGLPIGDKTRPNPNFR